MGARRTRTSIAGRFAAASVVGCIAFACFAPTQIVLRFKTNLASRAPQTAIQIGSENAYKQGSAGDGAIGELVVVPSGAHDALVEVKVALGVDGTDPNVCFTSPSNPRCVTAKRSFRFADHETRTFDVFLSSTCLGIACGPGQSCSAQTSACVDIRENETDPPAPPMTTPPGPVDGGEDGSPGDAPADIVPTKDGSDGACGPSTLGTGTTAPTTLVGTADALYWLDASGRLHRRAKTGIGLGTVIAEDIATLAAADNAVAWTRGTTAFGRINNGPVVSCSLVEAARAITLRAGAQPNDPPSAMFVSGPSLVHRYTSPADSSCISQASFSASVQNELAVTKDFVWGRSNIVNAVGGSPWTFVDNTNWNVSFAAATTLLLTAGPDVAVVAVRNQSNDTIFYRLAGTQISTIVTRSGSPLVTGLAADATFVYWLETPAIPGASTRLYRAALSGGDPGVPVAAFPSQIHAQGLVVDGSCFFTWAAGSKDPNASGSIIGLSKNP